MEEIKLLRYRIKNPNKYNLIFGQSHFIKSIEDLYETIITVCPKGKFGIAFSEASPPYLIRYEGTDKECTDLSISNLNEIKAGHSFLIFLKDIYPINILTQIKNLQEVCTIFAATANDIDVILAETDLGRGVLGIVDGMSVKGVETDEDKITRKDLLRKIIGYKF
ncbi:adenosine monophosphate-protein transferase [candidate division TA06 bacterium]|uniref:Adenosine monophosphate-protein transferase n=1 Tax=candidate division TA06 bacterium TaxID=2250710 RepID=A0A660SNF4_UNCT6|nr:MAG: adenosine monophosphate-protein transferase [candidate division TA06 bacterium]